MAPPGTACKPSQKAFATMPNRKTASAAPAAKSPATRRRMIALVLPLSTYIFGSDYYIGLLLGMVSSVHKAGYDTRLFMIPVHEDPAWDEVSSDATIAGALVVGDMIPEAFIQKLLDRNLPLVLVNNRLKNANHVSYVCCDNFNSAYDAVTYLASIGHKRIGMLRGPATASDAQDRFAGYKEALAENGLEFSETLVGESDFTEVGGYKAMKLLIARLGAKLPSAIFCANDDTAIGALTAMKEEGKRCPEDVALVGFDNIRVAQHITPPLTTVHQPVLEMGTQAAILLTELLEGKKTGPLISILPTELIIRKSCGVDS